MSSLQATEAECAATAVAPRVSLADIEGAINRRYDTTARRAVRDAAGSGDFGAHISADVGPLDLLSICILVMRNGFVVVGTSACASPENFNAELGKKLAYDNAIRQLWPLMGFALRDRLAGEAAVDDDSARHRIARGRE